MEQMIEPTATEPTDLAWYAFRDGLPRIGSRVLVGNTGPRVDGMPAVYLGARRKGTRGWEHLVRLDREYWVAGHRVGEIR